MAHVVVVGGGVFGWTGACELATRGHRVTVIEPGPVPHPDAASTDLSKIVRPDYGDDLLYTELAERSFDGWLRWNDELSEELFHPTGLAVLCRAPLAERPVERATLETLTARGHAPERLDADAIARRFPLWTPGFFRDGYVSRRAGWVASGRAIAALARRAVELGVTLRAGARALPLAGAGPVREVALEGGERLPCDVALVAAGAWTTTLVPDLADRLTAVAQPVLLLGPEDPEAFRGPAFPVWAGDITQDGWYGFPCTSDGVLKVANHGRGVRVDPRDARALAPEDERRARAFLRAALPSAAGAPTVGGRRCLYCDSFDGDFWIDADPARPGLVVAAGGSGHAFKFAPILGPLVADACEARRERIPARFRWRERQLGRDATDVLRARG